MNEPIRVPAGILLLQIAMDANMQKVIPIVLAGALR